MDPKTKITVLVISGSMMALGAGFLTATTLAQNNAEPARTVTIEVPAGETGPQGPSGPEGPPGPAGESGVCAGAPPEYSPGFLVINAPGGHAKIWACLAPE